MPLKPTFMSMIDQRQVFSCYEKLKVQIVEGRFLEKPRAALDINRTAGPLVFACMQSLSVMEPASYGTVCRSLMWYRELAWPFSVT